jgi:rhodanese-related sulfurtransferase
MTAHTPPAIDELSPNDVASLLAAGEILLIDVREPQEYAAERIHGALLYPLSTFDPRMLPDDRKHRVVLQCGSGKRSLAAAQKRIEAGAARCAHMAGGIGAWKAAGLPVIRIDPATGRVLDSGAVNASR